VLSGVGDHVEVGVWARVVGGGVQAEVVGSGSCCCCCC
jgi:hypothetical protein